MIKQTVTYKDFNDVERTEDFWFHLDKADLLELNAERDGGMRAYINDIVQSKNNQEILRIFKKFLLMSVGRRSADGRLFERTDAIRNEFIQTNAYSELLFQLANNEQEGVAFFQGILPSGLEADIDAMPDRVVELPADTSTNDAETLDKVTALPRYLNQLDPAEIMSISWIEFKQMQGRTSPGRMSPIQVAAAYNRQLQGK